MRRSAKIARQWPCLFPFVSGHRPPELQQIAGRLPAGHALTKELGAVAPAPRAAYIPITFPVILDDVECFAQKAGGAQRRFTYGDRAPDAESNRRVAGREYFTVVRPDRTA